MTSPTTTTAPSTTTPEQDSRRTQAKILLAGTYLKHHPLTAGRTAALDAVLTSPGAAAGRVYVDAWEIAGYTLPDPLPDTLTARETEHLLSDLADLIHRSRVHAGTPCDGESDGCEGGPATEDLEEADSLADALPVHTVYAD